MIIGEQIQVINYESNLNIFFQLFRYVIAGGGLFLIDVVLFYVFAVFLNINYLAVNSTLFLFGSVLNYILSYKWVFLNSNIDSHSRNIKVLLLVLLFSLLLSNLQLYFYIEILTLDKLDSKLLSAAVVFIWNFLARKYFVFRC
jgi:putative flippase GtrA